jgi:hypothetical protein
MAANITKSNNDTDARDIHNTNILVKLASAFKLELTAPCFTPGSAL